jgi:excisionase family DNA binding protein
VTQIPPNKSPLGLSTSQAAQALGVSLGTIRRWSDLGYLESYRTPGGQRRFSQEQIDRFIHSLESGTFRDDVRATG